MKQADQVRIGRTGELPVGVPDAIFRCACGAMVKDKKSLARHVNGKTVCQHRKMWEYRRAGVIVLEVLDEP